MAAFEPPECTLCGRCCFSNAADYVRVFGVDWDRMDAAARERTQFIENRCYMLMVDGHCSALRMEPSQGRFTCEVYDQRPDVCRSLVRGSGACRADYELKGDRASSALVALRRKASEPGAPHTR